MQLQVKKFKVKKGDKVVVLSGKSKGTRGEILSVNRETSRVMVAGANMVKRHTKPTQTTAGGIVSREASIHLSNVALIDPKSDKPTKIGYKTDKDGKKVRIARKSGTVLA
jgi:large subunit ribosomal protein L24